MREFYELTENDVGKSTIRCFGKVWPAVNFIGHVMKQDVGKRVYQLDGFLQVENDEQRAKRLAEARGPK